MLIRSATHDSRRNLDSLTALFPGLFLALAITVISFFLDERLGSALPWEKNPLSPILVALLLGLLARNILSLPRQCEAGITFGLKKILRFGIILMGIRLSFFAVVKIGALAVGLVIICISAALLLTTFFAKKLSISGKLGTLIAAGTSVCGVSAIVATGPTIDAEEEEIAYAVGTITIFGLLATIFYPYLVELVFHLPISAAGFFLGTSVHDTSQVTATALIYDQLWTKKTLSGLTGADIAITTKLVRNTFMIVVIPLLGYIHRVRKIGKKTAQKISVKKYIPLFVFGYVAMGIVRSAGDWAFGDAALWVTAWHAVKSAAIHVIAVAITCVGLNTDVRNLSKLGLRPFLCGLLAAVTVGVVSWFLVSQFSGVLKF